MTKTQIKCNNLSKIHENNSENKKYLGLDLSTQQLKAIVINDTLEIEHHVHVNFDLDLPEFNTIGGANRHKDEENRVTSPVLMWVKALDLCLEKLKSDGLDFSMVASVSGCAQQHGSVYWKHNSEKVLASLNPDMQLSEQLSDAFSLHDTPIWMDSSTGVECKQLESKVGGSSKLASITGSRAYERFTGPQIAKIYNKARDVYDMSERITLISNFMATLFCGNYAPFDISDASGMNLLDIKQGQWSQECLNGCGPSDLRLKLTGNNDADKESENIVNSNEVIGSISEYFVERHNFQSDCKIVSFTGDNPGSLLGMCVGIDEVVVSLGTSDTSFFWLKEATPGLNGHVLVNPIDSDKFMGLICFKNGSKTRERIRDIYADSDWNNFSDKLNSTPRGNFGNIGFYFDLREIYPLCIGDHRYNERDQRVKGFDSADIEIRACVEGQFMRLRHHSEKLGLGAGTIKRVLVTGGASANRAILDVIADIFNAPVYIQSTPNSACLGTAYMAKYALMLQDNTAKASFVSMFGKMHEKTLKLISEPAADSEKIYGPLMERYIWLEEQLAINNNDIVIS